MTAFLASCNEPVDTTIDMENDPNVVIEDTTTTDTMNGSDDMGTMDDDFMETSDEMGVEVGWAMMLESNDIVANAQMSDDHTTLVAAVKAADLVETLQWPGPFTVFAPTNAAFDALPAGTVDNLLLPENKDQLTSILTYHVVPEEILSSDLQDGQTFATVNGEILRVTESNGMFMINNVPIDIADARASNGVVHVIGAVLTPPAS